jgi:hypothetical protein
VVVFWESHVAQTNGAIFLWEPLAEWAINLGRVGRGQNFVRRYSCRFAAATTKPTPMLVRLQPLDTTSPILGRVEQALRLQSKEGRGRRIPRQPNADEAAVARSINCNKEETHEIIVQPTFHCCVSTFHGHARIYS